MKGSGAAGALWSRRRFCVAAGSVAALRRAELLGQAAGVSASNALRPDVAAIDREKILAAAQRYVAEKPTGIMSLRSENSPGTPQEYFSEAGAERGRESSGSAGKDAPFTAHRDAVFDLGVRVSALAAAQLLTGEKMYGDAAVAHLRIWFVDGATRMLPRMEFAGVPHVASDVPATGGAQGSGTPMARSGSFAGVIETLPLVEVVQAVPFLAAAGSLTEVDLKGLRGWFGEYLRWLTAPDENGPRLALLARDSRDHHATSWMLQVTAYTLFTVPETGAPKNEDRLMAELRHRFRSVTLRTQIWPEGVFRREISSPDPYRDSLFNLDMLACLCVLLSTRFEDVWDYQLEDGPGMRVAVAFHFPFVANRAKWPYRADAQYFNQLPGRRVSLLFAARAYQRPEYAALWKTLDSDPPALEVQRTMPVRQPLLWVRQPPRSLP